MITDTMRLELAPFNIKVVDLKTGVVKSGFFDNVNDGQQPKLPSNSIYAVAKKEVEDVLMGNQLRGDAVDQRTWANGVVGDLLKESGPPVQIWRGGTAWSVWLARRFLPFNMLDANMSKLGGLDIVKRKMRSAHAA